MYSQQQHQLRHVRVKSSSYLLLYRGIHIIMMMMLSRFLSHTRYYSVVGRWVQLYWCALVMLFAAAAAYSCTSHAYDDDDDSDFPFDRWIGPAAVSLLLATGCTLY